MKISKVLIADDGSNPIVTIEHKHPARDFPRSSFCRKGRNQHADWISYQ